MPACAFTECKNHSRTKKKVDGISYFHFPQNEEHREKWRKIVAQERGDDFFQATESSAVCSDHFLETDKYITNKGYQRIKKSAIPHVKPSETKPHAVAGAGSELVACRACLAVDGRLLPISDSGFEDTIAELTGVPLSMGGFPRHLCAYCRARLSKFAAFRESCRRSTALLQRLLEKGPLTMNYIKAVDRDSHKLTNGLTHHKVIHFPTHPFLQITPIKIEVCEVPDENESFVNCTEAYLEIEEINCNEDVQMNLPDEKEILVKIKKIDSEEENSGDFSENDACVDAIQEDTNDLDLGNDGIDINIELEAKSKSNLIKPEPEVSTKTAKTKTGNTVIEEKKCKTTLIRKKIGDEFYPNFNYEAFEKDFNVKIKFLTKEEQKKEIEENIRTNKLKSKYCCEMCGKGFETEKAMKNHSFCHDPSAGPVECEICRIRFRADAEPRRRGHRDRHQLTFTCQACGRVTRDKSNAKLHSLVHSGVTYACQHCDQVYKHQSSYQNHLTKQHSKQNVACNECGEVFRSEIGVQRHKARAHKLDVELKPEFKCSDCEVSFLSVEALDKHTQSSVGASHTLLFPCGACGESCGSDAARAQHTAEIHPPSKLHCNECGVTFSNAASFAVHARRKHAPLKVKPERRKWGSGPAPRAICEVCGHSAQSEAHLRLHLYSHMDQKRFACHLCSKTFAFKSQRKMHLRCHTGEQPYQCAHCPLAFTQKSNLVRHMEQVHLKRTSRFPCHICQKTFTLPSSVKLHVNTVHNNMPVPKRVRRPKKTADT